MNSGTLTLAGLALLVPCAGVGHAQKTYSAVRITTDASHDYHPRWSPDGSKIAFASHRSGKTGLWVIPAGGGEAKEVVTGLSGDFHIAWSPDGSGIAFDANGPNGAPDIWTVSLDGGAPERITDAPAGDSHPSWAPDGSRIAFTSLRSGNSDIWTVPANGGDARQVTKDAASDWHPRWSPDGSKIAFTSKRTGNSDLWTVSADGAGLFQLTRHAGNDDCASWSPDSSAIVFSSDRSGNMDIWTIPAAGGEPTKITDSPARDGWPSWSPDGSRVAFNSSREGNLDLWVVDVGRSASQARAAWPQWGGPDRNFRVETSGLADSWPDGGPKKLWYRELGDGYSSIIYDQGVLYTMYRKTNTHGYEYVIALDAGTGETLWEHRIRSPLPRDVGARTFGPNATPLVLGDRVYVTSVHAVLHCLDKKTGEEFWQRDLGGRPEAPFPDGYGYSCSPISYEGSVIVPAERERLGVPAAQPDGAESGATPGGDTRAETPKHVLAAFDGTDGRVVWTGGSFTIGHSSPVLIDFDGQVQLVLFAKEGLLGFRAGDGHVLWHHPLVHEVTNDAISTPVWNGEDSIYCSSHGRNSGGRVVKLTRRGGTTVPEEVWFSRRVHFGNVVPICLGDQLFGAGLRVPLGVELKTGRRTWAKRGFEGGTCVYGDSHLILLDLNGQLGLATATPEGLTVHSKCQVTERVSLTPPTLVGKTLYVRDRKHIMALDLG